MHNVADRRNWRNIMQRVSLGEEEQTINKMNTVWLQDAGAMWAETRRQQLCLFHDVAIYTLAVTDANRSR